MHARRTPVPGTLLLLAFAASLGSGPGYALDPKQAFPRLYGMNIGAKNFQDTAYQAGLARLDVAILGFYKGWRNGGLSIQACMQRIKARNPALVAGQYTILNEVNPAWDPDKAAELDARHWWALDAAGNKVQWTADYGAFEANMTASTKPDSLGRRWPQWLADRDFEAYFKDAPEFDIWYFDNVFKQPRVAADYDLDGQDDNPSDTAVARAFRRGHVAEWRAAQALKPSALLCGNVDGDLSEPEYRDSLGGAFLEGMMGKSWSPENSSWTSMMGRYRKVMQNTKAPHLVGFNVHGGKGDYRLMRYGLCSTLLDDGYFCYTDSAMEYSSVPWFDEYDLAGTAGTDWLGPALAQPPASAWQNGVWRRDFRNGIALVNPRGNGVRTVTVEKGFRRIAGKQAPAVNDGQAVSTVTLQERDGILLVRATAASAGPARRGQARGAIPGSGAPSRGGPTLRLPGSADTRPGTYDFTGRRTALKPDPQ